jgi:hypothetical protein
VHLSTTASFWLTAHTTTTSIDAHNDEEDGSGRGGAQARLWPWSLLEDQAYVLDRLGLLVPPYCCLPSSRGWSISAG